MLKSLWFSDIFRVLGMGALAIFGSVNYDIPRISQVAGDILSLYPLDLPESMWFSGVFGGYEIGTLARSRLSTGNKYQQLK